MNKGLALLERLSLCFGPTSAEDAVEQAIREELTERNNLPDYVMPHDAGFEGYNTSWKTPDFREVCQKALEKDGE